jgi:tRNA pseudouridine38-40 synthase
MVRAMYMLVAYDGTEFHGWQHQPGLRTVQGLLEQALRRVVRHQVALIGSGRTDAGVHAAGHVGSFETTSELATPRMQHAIGARLPKDVSIMKLREVQAGFHATRDAVSKLYRYRIHNAHGRPVEQRTHLHTYHFWQPLSVERMRAAARHFIGRKDFSAMAAQGNPRLTNVRTVLRCDLDRQYDEIRVDVEGDGFLYNQVRNMVGTLINVGRGHWEPDDVLDILASRDRANAGPTVPARGLCLQWVRYPAHLLRAPAEMASADVAKDED